MVAKSQDKGDVEKNKTEKQKQGTGNSGNLVSEEGGSKLQRRNMILTRLFIYFSNRNKIRLHRFIGQLGIQLLLLSLFYEPTSHKLAGWGLPDPKSNIVKL